MGEAKRRKQAGHYPEKTDKVPAAEPAAGPIELLTWRIVGAINDHPSAQGLIAGLDELRKEIEEETFGPGGNQMVVTLERAPRQPVVIVNTVGLGTFMNVIALFESLNLTDRLQDSDGGEAGVDAAFM